jgi:hypothetical protein
MSNFSPGVAVFIQASSAMTVAVAAWALSVHKLNCQVPSHVLRRRPLTQGNAPPSLR